MRCWRQRSIGGIQMLLYGPDDTPIPEFRLAIGFYEQWIEVEPEPEQVPGPCVDCVGHQYVYIEEYEEE